MSLAETTINESINQVRQTVDWMMAKAETWLERTGTAIDSLGAWRPEPEPNAPDLKPQAVGFKELPNLGRPDPAMLGEVGDLTEPEWRDFRDLVDSFDPYDPGPFDPETPLPSFPDPPAPIDTSGKPAKPDLNPVTVPDAPDLDFPVPEALEEITLPPVPAIVVPPFDVDIIPEFDEPPPSLDFQWDEADYQPLVLNELSATIRAMLAGGFAMPDVVQEALWAAARDREDITAQKAIQEAYDDFAAKGWSMPQGMLVEQVNEVRDRNQLARNSLSREVQTKAAQWAIENLRTAVAQGIALEGMWAENWNRIQQRAFEAARLVVELAQAEYQMLVLAFNTKIAAVQLRRDIFEAQLRAELAKLDILRAQIEAEQLKGQINEQRVRIYVARLDSVRILTQVFGEKVAAAKIQADIELSRLDGFKTEVEAWGEELRAQRTRFDAFETVTRGRAAMVGAYEAESRAYAAQISAASDRNNARNRVAEMKLRAIEVSNNRFLGLLQAESARISARRDAIAARAQAWDGDLRYLTEQLRYQAQGEELRMRSKEGDVRNNMAYFQTISHQFDARMGRLNQMSLAVKDALQAQGQMSAQMAAGAMSAIHAQTSISGRGGASDDVRYSYSGEIGQNAGN